MDKVINKCSSNDIAEKTLLELGKAISPNPIFILAAPRTGSTYFYQTLVRVFHLPYFSNLTNEFFPTTPIIGLAIQRGVKVRISEKSRFGKTRGPFQPSEGSGPMTHWFGGGHPSQDVSTRILTNREMHFALTLAACQALYDGAALVIKNAWNCFRVEYLAEALPDSRFIWLKRDIRDAAASDLEARYLTKGNVSEWNSATPSNVNELLRLRPEHQVVENQYEYNKAIKQSLGKNEKKRWIDVWFEDFLLKPSKEIERISQFLQYPIKDSPPAPKQQLSSKRQSAHFDVGIIRDYVASQQQRFKGLFYS